MIKFHNSSLMTRFTLTLFLAVLIPIGAVLSVSYGYNKHLVEKNEKLRLAATSETVKNRVVASVKNALDCTEFLAESGDVKDALGRAGGAKRDNDATAESIAVSFQKYLTACGYSNLYLIHGEQGRIVYTAAETSALGEELKNSAHTDSGLAGLWTKVVNGRKATMVDFSEHGASHGPRAFAGAPVFDRNGAIAGVVAVEIDPDAICRTVSLSLSGSPMGECYLVGQDRLMRSAARLERDSAVLKRTVDTPMMDRAFEGKAKIERGDGLRGNEVLSASLPLRLDDELGLGFDWAVIVEAESEEIFAGVNNLGQVVVVIGLILASIACTIGYFLGRKIVNAIKNFSERVAQMAGGDLTVDFPVERGSDEISGLSENLQQMLIAYRGQIQQLTDGAQTLATSIREISGTASQLATSATETATSVKEIATTVEEVRQTSYICNDKASDVAQRAGKATEVSNDGLKVTEEATAGMARVRQEMDVVAGSIVKLSEQTQSIGEIIGAVNDLADQSNLLSVNASIEAAKAGEFGKGFAVVASEVKTLANQSKEATEQVKTILNDIQIATSDAVRSTERSSDAVESGVSVSTQAGSAIERLSESIFESEQAAVQIAATSREQLVGIDQVATAMGSIESATSQSVDGIRHLENAIGMLNGLGQRLRDLTEHYRT